MNVRWLYRDILRPGKPGRQKPGTTLRGGDAKLLRVPDINQVKALGWRRHTRERSVPHLQYVTNPAHRPLPGTNSHQRTGNVAYHVVHKRIGLHINYDERAFVAY